jgi:hypothetical protein
VIQPARSLSPQQKKTQLFKEIMQDFDEEDVEISIENLLLAAEQVEAFTN